MTSPPLPPTHDEFRQVEKVREVWERYTPTFQGLGAVVFEFGNLEDALSQACGRLINDKQEVQKAIACEMSFPRKLEVLALLYPNAEQNQLLKRLLQNCEKCNSERNAIVHSSYKVDTANPTNFVRRKVTAKRKFKMEMFDKEVQYLLTLAEFIFDTTQSVNAFFYNDAIDFELPEASPAQS